MCGIAGFWSNKHANIDVKNVALGMAKKIDHRGPDSQGVWVNESGHVALAHRRLSIVDLSNAGAQPMVSPCSRYTIVFNGEIYNHQALRRLIADTHEICWKGHSDTETLLMAFSVWGIEDTLSQLNGMFAFALWDSVEELLFLARDRMGEKPLYYGIMGDSFVFASELKALRAHPEWEGEIDRNSLALFMRHGYVPAPYSIYKNIRKLPPANYLVINALDGFRFEPKCYWDLERIASTTARVDHGIDELHQLLLDAVKIRMEADVPLGAFLSGGYDSTLITALMQAQSNVPVKTFSIGFDEKVYNEADHAKKIAAYLGTEHTELYVTPLEAMNVVPLLPVMFDEPFADSSQIPTYLVSKMARSNVAVCLSGDGGDELFCGYNRYVTGYRIWQLINKYPKPIRQSLAWLFRNLSGNKLDAIQRLLPDRLQVSSLSDRLPKLAEVLSCDEGGQFYRNLVSHWKLPNDVVLGAAEPSMLYSDNRLQDKFESFQEEMMYLDMMTYLPDDILVKVDRASMAVSLEARVPFLDHRVVEHSWAIPLDNKYRNGQGKWILKEILYKYVPKDMMDRPKMGFGVPIESWLRGPLRDWAENLLSRENLTKGGYFNVEMVRNRWEEHISGKRRWHYSLWNVLMFQAWLEEEKL